MAKLVEIANMALGEVADQDITTLDDASKPARECKRFIYQAIREALASGIWKCARKPATLARLADAPAFKWQYAYQLPVDYVGMYTFNEIDASDRFQELFEVMGNQLLTDESTVQIVYIRDLSAKDNDVNLMPPLLTKACYLNLASKLAWPLQQQRTLKESLEEQYERAIRKAKTADTREDFTPVISSASGSRWLPARYSSTNG